MKAHPRSTRWTRLRRRGAVGTARVAFARLTNRLTRWERARQRGPVQPVWSDYLDYLQIANAGWLARGNVHCFAYALQHLPSDAPLVEIGSYCGLSANALSYLKARYGVTNRLITCDAWRWEDEQSPRPLGDAHATLTHADYRAFVLDAFRHNVRTFSGDDLPYAIQAYSDDFFAAWAKGAQRKDVFGRTVALGGPISFCYIDGDHHYDVARRDFINADRFLEVGGFVLFDDSSDDAPWPVGEVAREALATGRYALVARNPNYFLRKTAV